MHVLKGKWMRRFARHGWLSTSLFLKNEMKMFFCAFSSPSLLLPLQVDCSGSAEDCLARKMPYQRWGRVCLVPEDAVED